MRHSFKLADKLYTVTNCTHEDIPSHIEKVYPYWEAANVDVAEQQLALEQAVDSNTAWKVIDADSNTKAVIYCICFNADNAISNLLWIEDKRMFAILCFYLREYERMYHIYFMPHSKNYIPFKFVVEEASMRLFHSHNQPLEINMYSKKSRRLYEKHFLKYDIQVMD